MIEIIETVAGRPPHSVCAARNCVEPRRVLLLGLCAELQELQGDSPFFLSYEMAAKLHRHVAHSTRADASPPDAPRFGTGWSPQNRTEGRSTQRDPLEVRLEITRDRIVYLTNGK